MLPLLCRRLRRGAARRVFQTKRCSRVSVYNETQHRLLAKGLPPPHSVHIPPSLYTVVRVLIVLNQVLSQTHPVRCSRQNPVLAPWITTLPASINRLFWYDACRLVPPRRHVSFFMSYRLLTPSCARDDFTIQRTIPSAQHAARTSASTSSSVLSTICTDSSFTRNASGLYTWCSISHSTKGPRATSCRVGYHGDIT